MIHDLGKFVSFSQKPIKNKRKTNLIQMIHISLLQREAKVEFQPRVDNIVYKPKKPRLYMYFTLIFML